MRGLLTVALLLSVMVASAQKPKGILYKITDHASTLFERQIKQLNDQGYVASGTIFPKEKKGWAILVFIKDKGHVRTK